jgi:adenylate kinase family enzyme
MNAGHTLPQRIVVAGTTGSGKTTLARRLAAAIDAPHVELDALYHEANWTPADVDVFRARVSAAIDAPRWVVDGAYASHVWDIAWAAADTIAWLDYPFPIVLSRLFRRTLVRGAKRVELWNGNRESLRGQFASRDSLFLWARKSHWKYRRNYPDHFARPELAHARIVRLRGPRDAERFAREVESLAARPR